MSPATPATPATPPARPEKDPDKPAKEQEPVEVTPVGGTQDDLNPAFASPEAQAKTKKDWTKGAEHTVDAKEANKPEK